MRKGYLRFLFVLIFCLGLSVSVYAGEAMFTMDPNQFPYPDEEAYYSADDCWADVLFIGWLQAGDQGSPSGSFVVTTMDLSKLVNTSSVINAQQKHYLEFDFYDSEDSTIWTGAIPESEVRYNANANRIKVILKINDASLQSSVGEGYSQIRDILLNSWLKLDGETWIGTCSAPRMVET